MEINPYKRQGQMDTLQSYYYTDSIFGMKHLLVNDNIKMIIINSWKYFVQTNKIIIYGFVIMPNHLHLIWNMLHLNKKESPAGSFAKFTAHQFQKYLRVNDPEKLKNYVSQKTDRKYQFWKRDPLAVILNSGKSFLQKLNYIHNNPVTEKWQLTVTPEEYKWSSAKFYESGIDEFGIITDYRL